MSKQEKFIVTLLSGGSDHNLNFDDLTKLLVSLDFQCRAKGYQVKQVRDVLVRYQLIPGELNQ
jgi:hypothetical protein